MLLQGNPSLRLFAALGPGDIVGTARLRLLGGDIPETSVALRSSFLGYCQTNKIWTLGISSNQQSDEIEIGYVRAENRPKPAWGSSGIRYHVALLVYALTLAVRARRFRADIAIIDSGTTHYFALAVFRLLGVPIAVNLHNVLWPVGYEPTGVNAVVRKLNRWFFQKLASGAIGCAPECENQISKGLLEGSRFSIPMSISYGRLLKQSPGYAGSHSASSMRRGLKKTKEFSTSFL